MFAVPPLDHRIALVASVVLLLTAAAPLAYAWARLLPDEAPPFELPHNPPPAEQPSPNPEARRKNDPFVVFLLFGMSLSFLLKFPGLPVAAALQWLSARMPPDYFTYLILGARAFFLAMPGLAVVYSAVRPNPVRMQLILAGVFVALLWWLSPILRVAIAS